MKTKQNKVALKVTKILSSVSFEKLQKYLSIKKIQQLILKQLYSPDSAIFINAVNKIGKEDLECGWKKQEVILKFINDTSFSIFKKFLYGDLTSFLRVFWDNVAGFFGVDTPCEKERYLQSSIILKTLLKLSNRQKRKTIILEIFNALEQATYLASGSNRYVPLAICVINLFNNTNIYSLQQLSDQENIHHLLSNHLFYNKGAKYQSIEYNTDIHFPSLPSIKFSKPHINNKKIYWLDIGCAPKVNGSPTLRLLKHIVEECDFLKQQDIKLHFFGTDIFFPYYFFDTAAKEINIHKVFSPLNKTAKYVKHQGITYLNAKYYKYDATNKNFMNNEEQCWDFISACKVMHNFAIGRQIKTRRLAQHIKMGNKCTKISWINTTTPHYHLSTKQQQVIENLLRLLKFGGYFFLDLSNPHKGSSYFINYNFFLIITRISANQFKLHDAVIPYDPDNNKVYPHNEYILRSKDFVADQLSIKMTENHDFEKDYKKLQQLMRQLDVYVYYFQSIDNTPNYYLHKAAEAFKAGASLSKSCEKYIQGVHSAIKKLNPKEKIKILQKLEKTMCEIKKMENKHQQIKNIINVMLIGCGGAARDSYLPAIYKTDNVALVTIIIPGDKKSIVEAMEQIKLTAKTFSTKDSKQFIKSVSKVITPLKQNDRPLDYDMNWQEIEEILNLELTNKAIAAVIIGSPEGYHHKYIEWALQNNLHIACDKPLTSRIGVTTNFIAKTKNESNNKIAIATELINDYDRYITRLEEIEHNLSKKLQFEILTKKRYSITTSKIKEKLQESPAKAIQIFTADGWWLTPAQLARTDIFTMYGMDANKSDGGKLVHTAAHFLDLAIMFAREGRVINNFDINNIDVSVCFIRGYDSIVRSNGKFWLDVEAKEAGIINEDEKNILFADHFDQIKKLPEINLALQIKLGFSNSESVYVQLMGLHENLAKMANTSANYSEQFQSRTKVDRIFILQNNDKTIEYKRFGKIDPINLGDTIGGLKHQELYIDSKKVVIPFEDNLDVRSVVEFLKNVILTEMPKKKVTKNVSSYSHLRDHEFDIKILALIYKRIAEHYIVTNQNGSLFSSNRQVTFKYVFDSNSNNLIICSDFINLDIPFHTINKAPKLDKNILRKVRKISKLSGYGIISIQSNSFGGICVEASRHTTGFDYLDNLISLVQYSYDKAPGDEHLIDWQIKIHKHSSNKMLVAQVIFYGEKKQHTYIACQLQLMALNINIIGKGSHKQPKTVIQSLEISQGPFAFISAHQEITTNELILKDFYSKELMKRL